MRSRAGIQVFADPFGIREETSAALACVANLRRFDVNADSIGITVFAFRGCTWVEPIGVFRTSVGILTATASKRAIQTTDVLTNGTKTFVADVVALLSSHVRFTLGLRICQRKALFASDPGALATCES